MIGYYTVAEVRGFFNVSRATIDRWEAEQGFPKRVRLSNHPRGRCGFPKTKCIAAWSEERRGARALMPARLSPL